MATLIVAAVVSLAWCALANWLGPRIGYLDRPDDPSLKAHERPAVPLGGVGIFLGVNLAGLIGGDLDLAVLLATGMVLVLGLVDDRRGLPPVARLGAEVVAAVVLVVGTASPGSGVLFMALGVALVVFSINAINLFDGLDGLAGSVALVTAIGLAALAYGRGLDVMAPLELAAALGGFLVFNWQPARVFLGDAGAYVLGVLLAHLILDSTDGGVVEVVFTAGVLGVFAIDLFVTLVRRRLNDRPLFIGDRSHIYDQLRDRGLGVKTVALLASGAQALLLALLVATDRLLGPWQGLLALAIVLVAVVALLVRQGFLRVDPA